MEKTPRYTQRERNMVLGYAAQYKDVIENKRTDAESNRKKDEVWRQIAKEFNARVYHQRTSKQLRQLYKNMKLLLKKDLCGEGKGNRSFMDLLNTLSQQESVAQYIAEQMSPTGSYNNGRPKFDDDYDDTKLQSGGYNDAMDTGVIVIKSEEISDNDQTSHNGDMDDDDDDCLSTKDIPEVCLEEEDDEIFMTDLRQTLQQRSQLHISNAQNAHHQQQREQQQQLQLQLQQQQSSSSPLTPPQPEVTIQNVGGIRVGSIGSMANLQLKALQNSLCNNNNNNNSNSNSNNNNGSSNNSPVLSITTQGGNINNNSSSNNNHANNTNNGTNQRQSLSQQQQQQQQSAAEQAQQHLLLNGLGLSAVVHPSNAPPTSTAGGASGEHTTASGLLSTLPALQRAAALNNANSPNGLSAAANQLLMSLNGGLGGSIGNGIAGMLSGSGHSHGHGHGNYGHKSNSHHRDGHNNSGSSGSGGHNTSGSSSRNNDYLMSLAIEERKRKIDLLNAQIDYWKTLTKMLDANGSHNPTPACLCHFPGKVNGLQTQTSSS